MYLHDEAVGGREAEPVSRGGKEDGRRGQQMQEVHGLGGPWVEEETKIIV